MVGVLSWKTTPKVGIKNFNSPYYAFVSVSMTFYHKEQLITVQVQIKT
jgi:hypothetical protein